MLQILGMSYVGWVHAWWSTISIWCVYEFGYGCVCFLWVCGILAHNSCSSQVTAQFSRTYLAFLPRHDYHTPSTPVLAMWNISIIPEWNWSQVSEMNGSPQHPFTHSSLSHPCTLFPFRPTVSLSPTIRLQRRFLLSCNWNPLVQTLYPLSQLFVSAGVIGSFGSDISSVTSC